MFTYAGLCFRLMFASGLMKTFPSVKAVAALPTYVNDRYQAGYHLRISMVEQLGVTPRIRVRFLTYIHIYSIIYRKHVIMQFSDSYQFCYVWSFVSTAIQCTADDVPHRLYCNGIFYVSLLMLLILYSI